MSDHSTTDATAGVQKSILTAHDEPEETPEEITRRSFMANATITIGGIIGLVLAIPIVGSLIPDSTASKGSWSPLTADELSQLQTATSKPVKMTFTLKYTDGYLPEQATQEYVWGIKIDESKFKAARPDIYDTPGGNVSYDAVNMGFVIFSPICPHLGCRFNWVEGSNKFLCPCHGSEYNFDGTHEAGPAPRGLDPLPLREQTGTADITWIQYKPNVPDRVIISYQA